MSRTDDSIPVSAGSALPTPSTPSIAASPRRDGAVALTGAGIFAVNVLLLHVLESGFDPASRFISEYVLGDWGWLMNVAFVALGGAFLAVAHGLRRTLAPGRRVTASVRLMYIVGITTVLSGLFNSDGIADADAGRTTWHGALHDLSGFLGFVLATVVTFMLRGVFARDSQWRRFAPIALMFGITTVGTFVLMLAAPTDSFGIAQRVFVTIDLLWIAILGCALLGAEAANATDDANAAAGTAQSRGRLR